MLALSDVVRGFLVYVGMFAILLGIGIFSELLKIYTSIETEGDSDE